MNQRFSTRRRLLAGAATFGGAGRLAASFGRLLPGAGGIGAAGTGLLPRGARAAARAEAPHSMPGQTPSPTSAKPMAPRRSPSTAPLPDGLKGTLYRNGPARMRRGTTAYRHWFDGDGMVHAFRVDGTALRHQARMVLTDKYLAEEKAGRFLRPGFGSRDPRQPADRQA